MKKTLFGLLIVLSLIVTMPVHAANSWYGTGTTYVSIVKVGCLANGAAYAVLTDSAGAFTNKGFIMQNADADKSGLATLLTAFSMSRNLSIYADPDSGTINLIVMKDQ